MMHHPVLDSVSNNNTQHFVSTHKMKKTGETKNSHQDDVLRISRDLEQLGVRDMVSH